MRVLIAEDNKPVRRGIARLLSGDEDLEVCGESSNSAETTVTPSLKNHLVKRLERFHVAMEPASASHGDAPRSCLRNSQTELTRDGY
jgi:CheY-like chemotaxis protein